MDPHDDSDLRPISPTNPASEPASQNPFAAHAPDAEPTAGAASLDEWSALVKARETADHAAVVEAVRNIENRNTGWRAQLVVTLGSLLLFLGLGVAWWKLNLLWMLVAILFFHEAGHYIAMRVFGYRNVTLFFIPLLGAAVSGQHWNVAGWKKALVYLAGPVPGIALSIPLISWALETQRDSMFEFGCFMLLLNVLNLLPLMPLDGGRLMHLTVFGRKPILDLGARIFAVACLIGLVYWFESYVLLWVALPVLLSLPMAYRIASLVKTLRPTGNWNTTDEEISPEAISQIDQAIKQTNLSTAKPAQRAPLILQVYDGLASKAPGLFASILIWMLYAGALIGGLGGGVAVLARHGMGRIALHSRVFGSEPRSVLVPDTTPTIHLGEAPVDATELALVVAPDEATMAGLWNQLSEESRLAYSHVDLGTLRLVSIPGVARTPPPTNDSRLAYQRYVEEASRVRELSETFLAPLADRVSQNNNRLTSNIDHEATQIWMVGNMWLDSVAIHATAPNEAIAQQVLEDFFQEPSGFSRLKYIPVWSPIDAPSDEQLANRAMIATLLEGIYGTDDKSWTTQLSDLQAKQSAAFREQGYSTQTAVKNTAAMESLRRDYLHSLRDGVSGIQRKIADDYLRYADDLSQYHAKVRQISEKNADEPELAGNRIEIIERPDLDSYLAEHQSALAISDPMKAHHRYAVLASGQPWAEYYTEMSPEPDGVDADPETRIVISLHDADDVAIAIGGILQLLQQHDFRDLALHFNVPR